MAKTAAPVGDDKLAIEYVPIDELIEDPGNVWTHPDKNVDVIVASLRRFGQRKPIVVDAQNVVRAGNGTLRAARILHRAGNERFASIAVVRTSLVGADAAAYAIVDNRSNQLGEWNYPGLADVLRAIKAEEEALVGITGWADHELEVLLAAQWTPPEPGPMPGQTPRIGPITLTAAQRQVVERAVTAMRAKADDPRMTEGRAIELVCEAYLASVAPDAVAPAEA